MLLYKILLDVSPFFPHLFCTTQIECQHLFYPGVFFLKPLPTRIFSLNLLRADCCLCL